MKCNECDNPCKKDCSPCGRAEPVFAVEAMPDDPDILRFNVNGKSVWYDFSSLVKNGETATTVVVDAVRRTLNHYGEKSTQTISAKELGAIFHLSDFGDVDANSIENYGILNYRKNTSCPEGCTGTTDGWRADNPIDLGETSMTYVLGSDGEGALTSLMPPTNANKFNYLAWAAGNKVKYVTPTIVSTPPRNSNNTVTRLYLNEATGEIVAVREAA